METEILTMMKVVFQASMLASFTACLAYDLIHNKRLSKLKNSYGNLAFDFCLTVTAGIAVLTFVGFLI